MDKRSFIGSIENQKYFNYLKKTKSYDDLNLILHANQWIFCKPKPNHRSIIEWLPVTLKSALVLFGVMYAAFPLILKINPFIFSKLLFLHFLKFPFFFDLKNPGKRGLKGFINFYITVSDDIKIGAWHILPLCCLQNKGTNSSLNTGQPIVLYLHGNAATRAQPHRVELYKVLSSMDTHVIAIDYRGFADSSGSPSESGVLEDTLTTYKWIKKESPNSPLYVWGHSLGTAIAAKLVKHLNQTGEHINGLILEAPFTNLFDATTKHPMSTPFRILPWFRAMVKDTIEKADVEYSTDINIKEVLDPVLILHAEDDHIIPVESGRKLHSVLTECRPSKGKFCVMYREFSKKFKYRHNDIYKDPHLPGIIRDFMKMC